MARTLIGELILRLKDEMSGNAKSTAGSVTSSLDAIDRAAKRLSNDKWGVGFQSQLDKLKTSDRQFDIIGKSWINLHDDMQKRNLSKTMRGNELAGWKTAILANLSAVQAKSKATHAELMRLKNLGNTALKPVLVAAGGYTGAYVAGIGARAAINSASLEQRERAKQNFAGLPKSEQDQIEKQSQDLAAKYRISQAAAMEIMREARLAMPSAEKAFGVAKEMVQAYKMMGVSFGSEQAITGLRAFNKAMDNINVTEDSSLYVDYLNSFVKAQQITGKDMDPEAFAQAIKYARTSGKVFSPEFLQNTLPFLIAESGGSDAGTQLRAVFDQLIGGQATKAAKKNQIRLGLRDKNGIVDAEGFGNNPIDWINEHLVPALIKDGIDPNSSVDLAQGISDFFSNRLSKDFAQRAITQNVVYKRLAEMMSGATGLEGAEKVDELDPFSAFKGFKDSMANLSAAIVPIESISSGLISLADGINSVSNALRNGDPTTQYAVGGVAAAGAGGLAYIVGKSMYSLLAAGPVLLKAGETLLAAGVVKSGGDIDIDAGKLGKKQGRLGLALGLISKIPTPVAVGAGVAYIAAEKAQEDPRYATPEGARRAMVYDKNMPHRDLIEGGMHRLGLERDLGFGDITAQSLKAGEEIKANLSPIGKPQVDLSAINNALSMARQLAAVLGGIPALASQAASSADAAIRQAHTDFGGEAAP